MKKNLIIIVVMLSMLLACALTACAPTTCIDGHTLVDVEVRKDPTCDVVGEKVQKCSVCDAVVVVPIEALGHTYGEWSANEDGLTHSRVCATDNSHIQTANHVDADGNKICDDCSFEIPAIDPSTCQHQWTNWTYNGDGTHNGTCANGCGTVNVSQHCSGGTATCTKPGVCAVCGGEYLPATDEHVYVEEVTTPTGCETVGEMTYTCQCGDSYTEEIPAAGHAYGEWAYNNDGTHSRVCANDATHVEMNSCSGGVATCTDAGLCEVCDGAYIPALEHKYPENWTNNGENHIKVCENDSTHVISENHTHVETDRKDADCDNGEVITMTCQCGNTHNLDGEPALGHNIEKKYVVENGVLYWTEICVNGFDCSHEDIKTEVTGVAEVATAEDLKTVLENGFSAKLTEDIELSESINITSGNVSVDLNGHDIVNSGLEQSTVPGEMNCSVFVVSGEGAELTLAGEGNVVACPDEELIESLPDDVTVNSSAITAIENASVVFSGGTYNGGIETDGTANITINNGTFVGFDPSDIISSGSHSIFDEESNSYIVEEHIYVAGEPVAPNCTEDGYIAYTCVCGSSYNVTTEKATGHTSVTDEAVAPTCTETGLTEGSHCSVCDTVLVAQVVVPATDHDYPEIWTNDGENHIKVCGNDANHILTEEHNFVENGRTPANCENAEVITYTCICGAEKTENGEPAKGHNYEVVTTDPTCTRDGYTTYTCNCGDSYREVGETQLGHNIVKEYVVESGSLYWTEICTNECECNHDDVKTKINGVADVATAKDLKTVLENGFSARLTESITLTDGAINITSGEVELDLSGFDITSTGVQSTTNVLNETLYVCDVFVVSGYNTTFTIVGSGTVSANPSEEALEGVNEDDLSICVLSALDGAYVKLEGSGVYHSTGCTVIYARTESRVDIFDGGFIADEDWYGTYYTLDVWEGEHADLTSARINVYGGVFVEFNPANHSNDGGYTSKVVELYAHVVEIEDEEFGTVYVVEKHDGNNNADFKQSLCSVCGVCLNLRFHFVNGDKVYLFEKGDNYPEFANALIFTLEAVEGEDEVFYVYDNYSKAYLIYAGNDEVALSKDKSQNAKWHIYTDLTDDFYNIYFIGVGFDYELVIENNFYFISYCMEHDLQLDTIDATCTTDGGATYSCEHCGLYDIDVYHPATGHSYDDGVVTDPTCTEDGYTTYTCHCGDYYTEKGDHALGHEFLYLGGGGTHWVECDRCDYLDKDEPCFGGKADCEKGAICDGCGQKYIEALGHDYPDTWTNNGENHIKVCGNDPSHILTKAHYIEKIIGENATCTEPGSVKKVCICGAIIEEMIEDPIGHYFTSYVNNCDGTHSATCNRGDCQITVAEKHSLPTSDSIYCKCGALMFEKAYSVGVNDVIILVVEDGDNLNAMTSSCFTSTTSAAHLTIVPADVDGYYYLTSEGYYFTRRSPGGSRIQMTPAADELSRWIITILEDGTAVLLNDGDQLSIDDGGNGYQFGFNVPTNDLTISIYKLKDEDSFDHTWSKYIPNDDGLTHTRTCSTCGIQETNEHNYVVIGVIDATCESAGRLVYACECNTTFIDTDDEHPALGHEWSEWSRGDATNAQHSRECSRCSKTETEVCSVDKGQRLGYIVSDGVNGKLIAAQYLCTKCNELANKVCDEEIIPVANEAELRAAISAGRSVIFENDIHVTSTIDIDCELTGDITLDLDSWELSSYNCALFNIYDSDGQSQSQVTIKNGFAVQTDADNIDVCCPIAIVNNEVKLIIESGEFENLANNELFVVRNDAELWIKGGSFTVAYDGFSRVNDAFCSEHNGVIDLIDETGVDHDGSAYCSQAEFYGWDYNREDGVNGTLIILDGSHAIEGYMQGDYVVEYCQYDAVVTEPGCCDANGYTTYTCKVCGDSYIDDYTDPIDCEWSWKDNGDGTCTNACYLRCHRENGCNAPTDGPNPHEDMNNDYACDNCGAHIHNYVGTVKEPTCLEDGYTVYDCEGCSDSYKVAGPERLGHDFNKHVDNEDGTHTLCCSRESCKAVDGEPEEHVDTDSNKQCDICGAEIKVVAEPVVVTQTIKDLAVQNEWTSGTKYSNFELDSVISVSSSISGNNGKYYTSGNEYRLYQSDNGTITFSAETGYQILSIKITYTAGNNGCLIFDGVNIPTGTLVEVNADSITFSVGNTGTATNGQAKITAIEVVYLAVNPCDHNYVGEVTDPTCTDKGYTTYTCSYCDKSYVDDEVDALGHAWDWTYVDENTCSAVCLNDDSHTTSGAHKDSNPEDGNCDNCGESVTVTEPEKQDVTYTISFATTDNRVSQTKLQQVWQSAGLTFTNDKANSGTDVGNYSNPVRLYAGSTVTISCEGMTKIVIVSDGTAKYKDALTSALNAKECEYTINGNEYTIVFDEPVDTLELQLTAQARFKSLTVTAMQ